MRQWMERWEKKRKRVIYVTNWRKKNKLILVFLIFLLIYVYNLLQSCPK